MERSPEKVKKYAKLVGDMKRLKDNDIKWQNGYFGSHNYLKVKHLEVEIKYETGEKC